MSKQALQAIIDQHNRLAGVFKQPTIHIDYLTDKEANNLYQSIDAGMSPENLHCDGEITLTQARAKARQYTGAVKELQRMGFAIPNDVYEIG